MSQDEILNAMEDYIKVTDLIRGMNEGGLTVVLQDSKGKTFDLFDIFPDGTGIHDYVLNQLTDYKDNLQTQLWKALDITAILAKAREGGRI